MQGKARQGKARQDKTRQSKGGNKLRKRLIFTISLLQNKFEYLKWIYYGPSPAIIDPNHMVMDM